MFPPGPALGPRGISLVGLRAPLEMPQREDQSPELGPKAKIGHFCLDDRLWGNHGILSLPLGINPIELYYWG